MPDHQRLQEEIYAATSAKVIDRGVVMKDLFFTVLFNTLIAAFLTGFVSEKGFITLFIISQSIGISICSSALAGLYVLKPQKPIRQFILIVSAILVGTGVGGYVGFATTGIDAPTFLKNHLFVIRTVSLSIMFGSVISYFFISQGKISTSRELALDERIKRLIAENKEFETHLRLLQAQIEPHFLFNTLSNILSLFDTDPEVGKSMLKNLTRYLRVSLEKTRKGKTTIGQEIEAIRAYLNIFKVRMGKRLRFTINVPDHLYNYPFLPMLLQPLVENAIIHGLEPDVEGGTISIQALQTNRILRFEIADTGNGLLKDNGQGIGLTNIRERLSALYGNEGKLILRVNQPRGVRAIIELPYDRTESHHSR